MLHLFHCIPLDLARQVVPSAARSRNVHLSCTLHSPLHHQTLVDSPCQFASKLIVSMTGDYPINIPRRPLAHPWVTGPPAPTRSHRRFDPSKYYLEGWIDGGTETECRGPASRGQNEEVKSRLFVVRSNHHVSSSKVSPEHRKLQRDRGRKRIYMADQRQPTLRSLAFRCHDRALVTPGHVVRQQQLWQVGHHSTFHLWKKIVFAATCYRTSSDNSALVGITDPARHYLRGGLAVLRSQIEY